MIKNKQTKQQPQDKGGLCGEDVPPDVYMLSWGLNEKMASDHISAFIHHRVAGGLQIPRCPEVREKVSINSSGLFYLVFLAFPQRNQLTQ